MVVFILIYQFASRISLAVCEFGSFLRDTRDGRDERDSEVPVVPVVSVVSEISSVSVPHAGKKLRGLKREIKKNSEQRIIIHYSLFTIHFIFHL